MCDVFKETECVVASYTRCHLETPHSYLQILALVALFSALQWPVPSIDTITMSRSYDKAAEMSA
jgi:hypothetical protein